MKHTLISRNSFRVFRHFEKKYFEVVSPLYCLNYIWYSGIAFYVSNTQSRTMYVVSTGRARKDDSNHTFLIYYMLNVLVYTHL